MIYTVQPEQVDDLWPHLLPKIRKALTRSNWTEEDVRGLVKRGDYQLWGASDAIWMTRIVVYPDTKVCEIVLCGGSGLQEIISNLPFVETWAREIGCKAVRVYGREGWAKALKNYNKKAVVLEKALCN